MTSHVSSFGLRLGGASDDAVSSLTQGAASQSQHWDHVQAMPRSGGNVSDRFFLFDPALGGAPFIADRLRAALFVTFSASRPAAGLRDHCSPS
jgi:hypothetical protein